MSIGFVQGRLSPLVDEKIQAFPWNHWRDEFPIAGKQGFNIMEWTLDQDRLYKNPLMTEKGREEIKSLISKHNVSIPSLTGDCFMQASFFKASGNDRNSLLEDLNNIIQNCALLEIKFVVIPLVDSGRLENKSQEKSPKDEMEFIKPMLAETGIVICFESDFNPEKLANFVDRFEPKYFGINYDVGNSASLGYDPEEEIRFYGNKILNIHVKDRLLHGTTVPLGEGNADIPAVLKALILSGYKGNYILQTARAVNDDHVGVLARYRDQVSEWIKLVEHN